MHKTDTNKMNIWTMILSMVFDFYSLSARSFKSGFEITSSIIELQYILFTKCRELTHKLLCQESWSLNFKL